MTGILQDPAFWTAVALAIFVAVLLVVNVQGTVAKSLDARSAGIRSQIDEARKLRDEAQILLNQHERQLRQARDETEAILAQARIEAGQAAQEARADLAEAITRRRKQAEDKIARAEKQAVDDIRAYAATVSIGAARRFIGTKMDAGRSAQFVDGAIASLPEKLRR